MVVAEKVDESLVIGIESVIVVFDGQKGEKNIFSVYRCFEYGEEPLKLSDFVGLAEAYGYKKGCIVVYAEDYREGFIYRYNNYNRKEWMLIGKTSGMY